MGVNMANQPSSRTKDFFASPALSLSLAGIFRDAGTAAASPAENMEVEEGDEGSVGRRDETVEISSENSGPARSRSEEDFDGEGGDDDDDDGGGGDKTKKKKRKKYHRHTAEQIREMEALFKESPHPDEKQRQQLSKQLGLAPRQVKFWFQNRRTQIKAIQERHENSLLKSELDKLRDENKAMRETINKACCPNCGMATTSRDAAMTTEDQQLRIENAKLKAEVEKLRAAIGKQPPGTTTTSSSSAASGQENRCSLDFYTGIFGLEKSRIMEIVSQAMEELKKMATAGDPLWVRSVETGREILNYDEYMKEFSIESPSNGRPKRSIEASRDTGVVFVDLPRLVQSFVDVNQWKEMFPCLISKAATVDVICNGEGASRDGAVLLMFAELQMLTPMVPTREVYFVRYCKQLSTEQWAIVDVSIDKVEENIDASLAKCRKRPSGCIIEDKSNGHCKVIWVEHLECQKTTVHSMYRTIVSSGLAFGARHWMATLQLQCERLVFFMATNVPTKDSTGVATLAGRKSILKLAQRMTWNFCRAIGASSYHTWNKVSSKTGEDIRVASRKNINDPGEPLGVILCAVSSVWLPVSPSVLFDFLRDEAHRKEWDIMSNGGTVKSIANLAKGQDRGNAVSIHTMKSKENSIWVLQDSCTNTYESMVVYAPVDITGMQSVITGCDSSSIAILPSGFSILPDGVESRPLVITSRQEEKSTEGGSLLTVAFQILTNPSPTSKLTMESVDSVNTLISCTLRNIKTSLQCEDG
ncbi:Homeobox domain-containing protein/START domain-containing protein [Cephalotus follicularis]|uniref:Homeobox domain-containing protein/START domain-containing protein n=1 Tax=Cephalotus follicularis TaxID=3775 RepID=A0A1Q3B8V1_CEPFO|nr:Homeobox domain-containing protein/START domain-containing protein [Cephalotus follicularis]